MDAVSAKWAKVNSIVIISSVTYIGDGRAKNILYFGRIINSHFLGIALFGVKRSQSEIDASIMYMVSHLMQRLLCVNLTVIFSLILNFYVLKCLLFCVFVSEHNTACCHILSASKGCTSSGVSTKLICFPRENLFWCNHKIFH